MSKLFFVKYQGAGNDFILIDDRAPHFSPHLVPKLCHRKFGIGADGVILLQTSDLADFRMRIYNADGGEAEGCGNGLRCLVKFLPELGFPKKSYRIAMGKRVIEAQFVGEQIALDMGMATHLKRLQIEGYEVHSLNTGVPHAVVFTEEKLESLGPFLQNHPAFAPEKTNVNVAYLEKDHIRVRTFERGVGETLACGTGAAAVGFIASTQSLLPNPIRICMPGGDLHIEVKESGIRLIGDALKVFEGVYTIYQK